MALNTIEYASKLQTGLDQKAVIDATSGWMDENAGQVIYTGDSIFTAPDIMCQSGDSAVITTLQGQTYRGIVGKSFSYESHTETALMIEMVV